jgi:two-component system cell cycle sensor histidine kinase/response regulator CckA
LANAARQHLSELQERANRLQQLIRDEFRRHGFNGTEPLARQLDSSALHMLEELGDAVPVPLYIRDLDGRYCYCNAALEEMLGLDRSSIIGRDTRDLFPAEFAQAVDERMAELLRTGADQVEERTLPSGSGVDVRIQRSLLRNQDGHVIGLLGAVLDLMPQKNAQRAQALSEARYRNLFQNALDSILVLDGLHLVECNPAACELFGMAEEELTGKSLAELSPEMQMDGAPSRQALQHLVQSACRGGRRTIEWSLKSPVRGILEVDISLSPLHLDGRDLVLALVRDVSEYRRAQAALEASEQFSRGMVQHAPIGVLYTDLDGTLIFENEVMAKMLGVPEGQRSRALGKRLQDLPGLEKVGLQEKLARVARGEVLQNLEFVYESLYGRRLRMHVQMAPHSNPDGRVVGAIFMIQDVTELRRLEEQLHHAQKMDAIGNLAGGIAHDFNNLLTGISGNAEMALQMLEDPDRVKSALKEMIAISDRASQLTQRLLSFSRRQESNPRPVIVSRLIEDIRRMLQRLIGEQIQLDLSQDDVAWAVQADPGQLEQVIVNLVVNARDAMPDGGRILMEIQNVDLDEHEAHLLDLKHGPHLKLSISDTGHGIDEEQIEHIFDPFFTTKQVGKGTGLGLSIVYGIIRQCGGAIEVESSPGDGTTFTIHLPSLGTLDAPRESAPRERRLHMATGAEEILVIEDEDAVRELTVRCLEHCGYTVYSAADGEEALELVASREAPVDLILSDVIMPGMSGPATVRRIREIWPNVTVLFCSGYTDGELKKHRLSPEEGAALLNKPYSLEDLSRRIRETLDGFNSN